MLIFVYYIISIICKCYSAILSLIWKTIIALYVAEEVTLSKDIIFVVVQVFIKLHLRK